MTARVSTNSAPGARLAAAKVWAKSAGGLFDSLASSHAALAATLAFACLLHWLAPRLPMIDLPQHAGQVALWRDLLLGQSAFADILRINLLTPYLIGYGLALPLSFLVPAGTAIQIVLTGALIAFVVSGVQLRRDFSADPRLDWLLLPAFFSFSWHWGFYTFLVAAPLALQFIRLAHRHANDRALRSAAMLVGLGALLLLSHGLAFLFACLVGGVLALAQVRSFKGMMLAGLPYVVLGAACLGFLIAGRGDAAPAGLVLNDMGPNLLRRVPETLAYAAGSFDTSILSLTLTSGMLLAPFLLGLAPRRAAVLPLAVLGAVLLAVPHKALDTAFLWERFSLYVLPFYALLFAAPGVATEGQQARRAAGAAVLVLACWATLGLQAAHVWGFGRESAELETVLAAAEPRRRAVSIILRRDSPAAANDHAYLYQPSWYQADKGGLVDFNFALFHPQVVRFAKGHEPKAGIGFAWQREAFDWDKHGGRIYDYFFIRHSAAGPPRRFTDSAPCEMSLVKAAGSWSLYRRGRCRG